MTIGSYDKHPMYVGISNQVDVTHWQSTKHNMGMALTREVWIKIKDCTTVSLIQYPRIHQPCNRRICGRIS